MENLLKEERNKTIFKEAVGLQHETTFYEFQK